VKEYWNYKKNEKIPSQYTAQSGQRIHWRCQKGPDHEWVASIAHFVSRLRDNSVICPVCNNTKIVYSNSLAALNPQLAKQWHPNKNKKLTPDKVGPGSHKIVYWLCEVASDHEWKASIAQRNGNKQVKGNGCPMCRGSIVVLSTCLATKFPLLATEFHLTKNGDSTPFNVHPGSKKKVFWMCKKNPEHEWEAQIANRVDKPSKKGSGCPFCSGTKVCMSNCLVTTHPEIAKEWDSIKNGDLKPTQVTAGSGKKRWWICSRDESHSWYATISSRSGGNKCPICSNKKVIYSNSLAFLNADLVVEWHPTKNILLPIEVVPGSTKKVWWLCPKNHEWQAAICDRVKKKSGCQFCYKNKF
jgi:hypothetical protein